jgi:hypothetical protein
MSEKPRTNPVSWYFHVEEVSAGVYQVTGTDQAGRRVEMTGTEPEQLLSECRRQAVRISREANMKQRNEPDGSQNAK